MPSKTIENYIKQIYALQQQTPGKFVHMGRLAELMKVVPGTATSMMKALSDANLVDYEPRAGVKLTDSGRQLALHVLRRHRLVELLLVQMLGLDWSEVHDEAEEIEHVVSDKLLDAIDRVLGRPVSDPHGDPIPSVGGQLPAQKNMNLADCPLRRGMKIVRVLDQHQSFLHFARQAGLLPGKAVVVEARDPHADAINLRIQKGKKSHSAVISFSVAEKFLVEA
ncbi:MAG TPA: metal-dependent transcriptional regulator [Phycisphaerae bacterium]|nr:metal-dependent transcriptional regulator [Phycisphaerae bacterium]